VFDHYAATLLALAKVARWSRCCAAFEWRLLDDLGYGELSNDLHGDPIAADGMYRLQVDAGLERVYLLQPGLFKGTELLAMAKPTGPPRRLVCRQAPDAPGPGRALGGRPLVSRELFRKP
jgi:DNA repair protein RecO (recombination protein O)